MKFLAILSLLTLSACCHPVLDPQMIFPEPPETLMKPVQPLDTIIIKK